MLNRVFGSQAKTITSAAVILATTSLVSRALGVLRDRVLAAEFGATRPLDIYYSAFRLPDLIFNLVVVGAISAGFIPLFARHLEQPARGWRLTNIVLSVVMSGLVVIGLVVSMTAPWLVRFIAPGFSPDEQMLTAQLSVIMFLSPLLLGISSIMTGILQSFQRFFITSLAPIFYNIGIIFGALVLVRWFGLYGLAWGVVLGALLHLVIQLPMVWSLGYRFRWQFLPRDSEFISMMKLMVPRTLGLLTTQLNITALTILASALPIGSIAIFNFANNLQGLPLGLFGVSFAVAAFPMLASLANQKPQFIQTLVATMRQVLFLTIPASALLIVLRAQIVRIVLGAGRFSWADTSSTLTTLSYFALSLFAQALLLLLIRAFYALHDSRTPFQIGVVADIATVALAWWLVRPLGVAGLALGSSIISIFEIFLLLYILWRRLGGLDGRNLSLAVTKYVVATFGLVVVAQGVKYLVEPIFGTSTFIGLVIQSALAGGAGVAVYIILCWLLGVTELQRLTAVFGRRFSWLLRSPRPTELLDQE